ncbi:MAG: cyclic nucleotide-binding/CBS domain-containing protein [Candidatus Woesearchaeota archaeon]
MLTAKDIMAVHVVTVDKRTTIREAAARMDSHDVGSVLVVENNIPVGIVTETDFTRQVVAQARDLHEPIHTIMTSPLHSCLPEADIMQVAHALRSNHIKKLPVISGGKLYGVVTQTDVIRHVVSTIQDLAHQYKQGTLTGEQYATQATELFHTFNNSLDEVSKNWHMKCLACDYRFLAAENHGSLSITSCPKCASTHIAYDQNPEI